jgi:ubiquinone/menaquinone biosynthesis C-methylase UbiE
MKKIKLIDKEIIDFYNQTSEGDRLKYGLGPLEFERVKELVRKFLPGKSAAIIDVGGGPGVYSEWLSESGHDVYLVDPIQKHIEQAIKRSQKLKQGFKCILGEAGNLELPEDFADVIVMHGPLYHLQDLPDRLKALNEAYRVLKPGGVLLGFAINYTASVFVSLTQGLFSNDIIRTMCLEELDTGIHEAPAEMKGVLPKAFYHRPEQLIEELSTAAYKQIELFAVEGIIWLDKNYFETRSKNDSKRQIMELLRKTESDKNLLAVSPHIMAVGRKLK